MTSESAIGRFVDRALLGVFLVMVLSYLSEIVGKQQPHEYVRITNEVGQPAIIALGLWVLFPLLASAASRGMEVLRA